MIEPDFGKLGGFLPAVLQHAGTDVVLAAGVMNRAALLATLDTGRATLLDRRSGRLFVPGESSGDYARVLEVLTDCEHAALLLQGEGPLREPGGYACLTEPVAVARRRSPPAGMQSPSRPSRRKDGPG